MTNEVLIWLVALGFCLGAILAFGTILDVLAHLLENEETNDE